MWGTSSLNQFDTSWQLLVTVHVNYENHRVKWKQIEKTNSHYFCRVRAWSGNMAWQTGGLGNAGGTKSATLIFLFSQLLSRCMAILVRSVMAVLPWACVPLCVHFSFQKHSFLRACIPYYWLSLAAEETLNQSWIFFLMLLIGNKGTAKRLKKNHLKPSLTQSSSGKPQ